MEDCQKEQLQPQICLQPIIPTTPQKVTKQFVMEGLIFFKRKLINSGSHPLIVELIGKFRFFPKKYFLETFPKQALVVSWSFKRLVDKRSKVPLKTMGGYKGSQQ